MKEAEVLKSRPLEPNEREALSMAGGLLRFAAERQKIPQDIISPIVGAFEALKDNKWDNQTATKFWSAYNFLCVLIKPVTIDSLATNINETPPPKWQFWRRRAAPLSKRTVDHYLITLTVLLFLTVNLGFVVSTANRLAKDISDLLQNLDQVSEKITANTNALETKGVFDFSQQGDNENDKLIAEVKELVQQHNYLSDQLLQKTRIMSGLISFGFNTSTYKPGTYESAKNVQDAHDTIINYYQTRRYVRSHLLSESVTSGIISSILPIILGLMGACSYIIRLISDQIKDSTFSSASPIRHQVRLALGGLAGIIIGFGGIFGIGGVSPSAAAFAAGYAVEPVFATLDNFAEKFRRGGG